MKEFEKVFLQDTIDILVNYDRVHQVEGMEALLGETRERLIKLARGKITEEDIELDFNSNKHFVFRMSF